jgi:hypothetical protein
MPHPVTQTSDPEHLSAEQCQAMDFIMSGMTPDDLSRLFEVSDRYRNYHAAKTAQHVPPAAPQAPPAHDDPGRALYEYRAARDAARAAVKRAAEPAENQAGRGWVHGTAARQARAWFHPGATAGSRASGVCADREQAYRFEKAIS